MGLTAGETAVFIIAAFFAIWHWVLFHLLQWKCSYYLYIYMYIYFLTAIVLTPVGSSTEHIYTQTIHKATLLFREEYGPCPVFASHTLAFVLQLRKKQGKPSVRVAEECQLAR
jgi:hypothetical protein